ncbi:MAG: single-stranded DNA-binding protein, partial [Clostridia bacterium]|nr:single-stranded DNA-binding protein [Clostridia bacterium]
AEFICRNFPKGKQILVEGQLQNRSWTDNNGQKRTSTEINVSDVAFVGNKSNDGSAPHPAAQSPSEIPSYSSSPEDNFTDVSTDDELPF